MKFSIDGIDAKGMDAGMGEPLGGGEYTVRINGADRKLRVLRVTSTGIEFMLDDAYHKARYVSRATREISMIVDGVEMSLGMHADFDDIVYKNSGGAGADGGGGAQASLKSQIPGKVVSVAVSEGDTVAKGDVVCTLESMKMQVAVKAHKDGTVGSIKVRESATVAKGDTIAEIN
ncbi:MAG: biotin/lipoyl-binding protein [Thaumarchaeota archaeon]|nr:biotin/lipoyl-binding protein [Nitrososphaerota archaeon]